MPTTLKAKPRKVNPFTYSGDFQVALLAQFGFSTKLITKETGLTPSQVSYRTKKFGIKRSDYRDGTSMGAEAVSRIAQRELHKPLYQYLEQKMHE
jgi:hypothetical protein